MRYIWIFICAALLLTGCRGGAKQQTKEVQAKSNRFAYVSPPSGLTDSARVAYMREHFWDKFDFADSLSTQRVDTMEVMRAMSIYLADYVGPTNQAPIRGLMQKASASRPMFDYFVMILERLLHDANSPLRSDELYLAVLEAQSTTPLYDKYERMAPAHDLHIASQNRIGHISNNFRYTLQSGKSYYFNDIKSELTLLYFTNPDCSMCSDILAQLVASQTITEAERSGRLKIVTMYTDRDMAIWRNGIVKYPQRWINGYDNDCVIEREQLYDLKAVPSIYLMDSEKRVLIKDSTSIAELESMILNKTKAIR